MDRSKLLPLPKFPSRYTNPPPFTRGSNQSGRWRIEHRESKNGFGFAFDVFYDGSPIKVEWFGIFFATYDVNLKFDVKTGSTGEGIDKYTDKVTISGAAIFPTGLATSIQDDVKSSFGQLFVDQLVIRKAILSYIQANEAALRIKQQVIFDSKGEDEMRYDYPKMELIIRLKTPKGDTQGKRKDSTPFWHTNMSIASDTSNPNKLAQVIQTPIIINGEMKREMTREEFQKIIFKKRWVVAASGYLCPFLISGTNTLYFSVRASDLIMQQIHSTGEPTEREIDELKSKSDAILAKMGVAAAMNAAATPPDEGEDGYSDSFSAGKGEFQ